MLLTAKQAVRTYSVAITETASPDIHKLLKAQLDKAIEMHQKLAQFLNKKGYYYAYDLNKQQEHDVEKVDKLFKKLDR